MKNITKNKKLLVLTISSVLFLILIISVFVFSYFFPNPKVTIFNGDTLSYSKTSLLSIKFDIKDGDSIIISDSLNGFSGERNIDLNEGIYTLIYTIGSVEVEEELIIDKTAPQISFETSEYTNTAEYSFDLTTSESSLISISNDKGEKLQELEDVDGVTSINISLNEGQNAFTLEATDKGGNNTKEDFTINLDTIKPEVSITSPTETTFSQVVGLNPPKNPAKTITVTFKVTEEGGLRTIKVNGKEIALIESGDYSYQLGLNGYTSNYCSDFHNKSTDNEFSIEIFDMAGNSTKVNTTYVLKQSIDTGYCAVGGGVNGGSDVPW